MSSNRLKAELLSIIIEEKDLKKKPKRIDQLLAENEAFPSRSQLKTWFSEGRITRSGEVLKPGDLVRLGDQIDILMRPIQQFSLEPRPLALRILHEDADLIVLYKDRGLSMHPGASDCDETTLVHALLAHSENLSTSGGFFRPGIVHRLDKDTEGVVVVAKNNEAHDFLSKQFEARTLRRSYWALCIGRVPTSLVVEGNLGRHPRDRKKMAVLSKGGKFSRSEFKLLQYFEEGYSWVECRLKTGRTHQIRVHLQHRGYPILNDPVYGRGAKSLNLSEEKQKALSSFSGQALVAFELGFVHPTTSKELHFLVDPPDWMKVMIQKPKERP